jgi:hypothetical protein
MVVLAVIRAAIVFCGTLLLSWGSVAAMRRAVNAVGIVAPVRWSLAAAVPTLPGTHLPSQLAPALVRPV